MKKLLMTKFAAVAAMALCAILQASAKELKVSILGDSYSTFEGEIPDGNAVYYFKAPRARNGVDTVEKTWWHQVVTRLGATVLANESWSGSTVSSSGYDGRDSASSSFVTRADRLGGDPDVILICGGTNDSFAGSPMGEFKWSDWTAKDNKAFRPALANMYAIIKRKYPKAKILFIINGILRGDVKDAIRVASKRYGAETVELRGIELNAFHPTEKGMTVFADQVMEALAKMGVKPNAKSAAKAPPVGSSKKLKVSFFGDSYSTFEGENPKGNRVYFFKPPRSINGIDSPEKTWWWQVASRLDATVLANESWSGSTVSSTGYDGEDFGSFSFVTRADRLGDDPDVILVCAGTNDSVAGSPLGKFKWSDWTAEDLKTFRPSAAKLFSLLKANYPKAKILSIVNVALFPGYKDALRVAAKRYGVASVDLHDIELVSFHPTVASMRAIADQVMEALAKMGVKPR